MPEAPDVDATVQRIETLIEQLSETDPRLRQLAEEAIRLLMQLYGAGLARGIEMMGPEETARLAEDKLIGSLLLLHGLHPVSAAERIGKALGGLEGRLDGHQLHLAEISGGVARIQVELNGGAVPAALAGMIERAIAESAPDIAAVEIEGLPAQATGLVQIAPAVTN